MKDLFAQFPAGAKCTRCKQPPGIRLRSHHAIYCSSCFLHYFQTAVKRAMRKFRITREQPLMVAVSGGKDSLALWAALHQLGYPTKGLHVSLGIDDFSNASIEAIRRFAEPRQLQWANHSLQQTLGYSLPEIRRRTRRKICAVCGTIKRQMINRLTIQEGFSTIAMGHNLDDEAGRLLGNMVRHRSDYFERQYPYLPSTHPRLPAKCKPLYRLETQEVITYCKLNDIEPVAAKCGFARGATSHSFKQVLDFLEEKMPGTKRDFLYTYLENRKPPQPESPYRSCCVCGEPCYGDVCSVCNLLDRQTESPAASTE